MKLPAWSNSITGGAGVDFVSADVDRGFARVLGRLRTHTLPSLSPVTADPNPILYLAGTFGQEGSLSNCGTPPSPICGASADAAWPKTGNDTRGSAQTKRIPTDRPIAMRFMGSL